MHSDGGLNHSGKNSVDRRLQKRTVFRANANGASQTTYEQVLQAQVNSCFTGTPRTCLTGASEQLFYRHKRTALHENDLHTNDLQTANSLLLDTVSTGCHEFVISQIITTTLTAKIGSAAKIALNRKRGDLIQGRR